MEVEYITNRMVIMKARAMGKTSVHKAYDEDWWWEPHLKKFLNKLLDKEPSKIIGPNLWKVYFFTGGVSYWKEAVKKMITDNCILYRMGVDVAGTGGDYSVGGLLHRAKSKVRTSPPVFKWEKKR